MSKKDYDVQFKLVIVGDTGVGKSSVLLRFTDGTFQEHASSIGVDFKYRTVKHEKKGVKLQIWDTAGQEKFRTLTSAYYRGADAIVMVYDVTNVDTFNHVGDWLAEVNRYASEETCKLLIGNKSDREDKVVTSQMAQEYAQPLGILSFEASAKKGINVEEAFMALTGQLVKAKESRSATGETSGGQKLKPPGRKKGSCC